MTKSMRNKVERIEVFVELRCFCCEKVGSR